MGYPRWRIYKEKTFIELMFLKAGKFKIREPLLVRASCCCVAWQMAFHGGGNACRREGGTKVLAHVKTACSLRTDGFL
jgi:hypothetical protein